jgi:hypothetical protein
LLCRQKDDRRLRAKTSVFRQQQHTKQQDNNQKKVQRQFFRKWPIIWKEGRAKSSHDANRFICQFIPTVGTFPVN